MPSAPLVQPARGQPPSLQETDDVHRIRFATDKPLGSGAAAGPVFNILARTTIAGEEVIRPYNPITAAAQAGFFEICVKR